MRKERASHDRDAMRCKLCDPRARFTRITTGPQAHLGVFRSFLFDSVEYTLSEIAIRSTIAIVTRSTASQAVLTAARGKLWCAVVMIQQTAASR
jgi:hypothetical protein